MRFLPSLLPALLLAPILLLGSCRSSAPGDGFDYGDRRPPTAHTLHSTARVMASQGRDEECEVVLNRLIADHPRYAPAYVELAELYLRNEAPSGAERALLAGLEAVPGDPVLLNDLGMVHVMGRSYQAAIERFVEACAAAPSDARPRANLAVALGLLGRYEEALAVYLQVLPPEEAHHNLGVLAETRGDEEQAAHSYARAQEWRRKSSRRKEPLLDEGTRDAVPAPALAP